VVKIWADLLKMWDLLFFSIQGNPHSHSISPLHMKNLILNRKGWLIQYMAVEKEGI